MSFYIDIPKSHITHKDKILRTTAMAHVQATLNWSGITKPTGHVDLIWTPDGKVAGLTSKYLESLGEKSEPLPD